MGSQAECTRPTPGMEGRNSSTLPLGHHPSTFYQNVPKAQRPIKTSEFVLLKTFGFPSSLIRFHLSQTFSIPHAFSVPFLISRCAFFCPLACSSQSPNSLSLPAAPLWGAEVVFVRWVLLCQGSWAGAQTERVPLLWHHGLVNKCTRGLWHGVTSTQTHGSADAHPQISNTVRRRGRAEWR